MDFRIVRKSHSKKRKLMLWVEEALIEKIDMVKPAEITTQEAMRQLLEDKISEMDMMSSL